MLLTFKNYAEIMYLHIVLIFMGDILEKDLWASEAENYKKSSKL